MEELQRYVTPVFLEELAREIFAFFDVEDGVDEAVLVPISLREAERLICRGARRCTVINR
ncbi:hypothetical protein ACTFO4_18290 [Bacillus cereus group sp. MYBKT14-1]|uniref:hypothetical protein n=1 Tax=Bacillus cereus group TaxID=86661 RepID=UPI00031E206A|nr:hypothetical protein [Bacillus cereus]MEC1983403.1 hypothetical protein [Bacillus cereus]OPA39394.1 hypothetical protein BHL07_15775 [Bacillus cereus]UUE91294.1 hypothetical protein L2I54_12100 [Bacillus cereus]